MTSEGVARADGVEEEVVGAEPPPSPPLAASVVIADNLREETLSLSLSRAFELSSVTKRVEEAEEFFFRSRKQKKKRK